jgi:hypothetical protein
MYLALAVLTMLFQCIFAVSRPAMCTDALHSYLSKFPPAVIRIRYGASFWRRKSTTGLAEVKKIQQQVHVQFPPLHDKHPVCPFLARFVCYHIAPSLRKPCQRLFAKPQMWQDHSLISCNSKLFPL